MVFSHCPVLPRGADEGESCFTETITRKPNTSTSQHDEWSETPSVDTVLAREMLYHIGTALAEGRSRCGVLLESDCGHIIRACQEGGGRVTRVITTVVVKN
jgi:hypothetical protein